MGKAILVMVSIALLIIQARYALQCCVAYKEKELKENHIECNYANKV
jgi:hypothetical protein